MGVSYMKRRIFAVLLMALLLSALSMPIVASAFDVQPYGAAIPAGGLVSLGGNQHYLWISVDGFYEYKTGTSTLYRQKGSGWERITSVSVAGYDEELENRLYLTLTSGYYKVASSVTTPTSSATTYSYYNI